MNQQPEAASEAPPGTLSESPSENPRTQMVFSVDGDEILKSFAAVSQKDPTASMGLTVTVAAGLITGDLIGANRWFKEIGEAHPELRELAEGLGSTAGRTDLPDDQVDWTYIHLRNARIFTGGQQFTTSGGGIYWRGRISEITGWSFGIFSPE